MSETHDRWHDDLAAYALGSLQPGEVAAIEQHLASCEDCQERLRWLSPAVEVLSESTPRLEAPPKIRERLMAEVRADAAAEQRAAGAGSTPRERSSFGWLSDFMRRPAIALACVGVIAAGVAGFVIGGGGDGGGLTEETVANKNISLEAMGDSGTLEMTGLAELPEGQVYQAWVEHDGHAVASSLFAPRADGTASAAIPEDLEGADAVMVTIEPQGGSTEPTGIPLMSLPLN